MDLFTATGSLDTKQPFVLRTLLDYSGDVYMLKINVL